jgi:hypothetical protein
MRAIYVALNSNLLFNHGSELYEPCGAGIRKSEHKVVFLHNVLLQNINFSVGSLSQNFHFPKCVFPQKVFQGNLTSQKTRKLKCILGPMTKKHVVGGRPSSR